MQSITPSPSSARCSVFVFDGRKQRPDRPSRGSGGNPLVVIVRKPALEIGLELRRPAAHVPGAVLPLCVHQKLHALLVNRAGRRHRSEEHTSELQSLRHLVCRLLLEKKKKESTDSTSINKTRLHTSYLSLLLSF